MIIIRPQEWDLQITIFMKNSKNCINVINVIIIICNYVLYVGCIITE